MRDWVTNIVRDSLERAIVSNCERLIVLTGYPQKITLRLTKGKITIEREHGDE